MYIPYVMLDLLMFDVCGSTMYEQGEFAGENAASSDRVPGNMLQEHPCITVITGTMPLLAPEVLTSLWNLSQWHALPHIKHCKTHLEPARQFHRLELHSPNFSHACCLFRLRLLCFLHTGSENWCLRPWSHVQHISTSPVDKAHFNYGSWGKSSANSKRVPLATRFFCPRRQGKDQLDNGSR